MESMKPSSISSFSFSGAVVCCNGDLFLPARVV
jgi:hypothetical protein